LAWGWDHSGQMGLGAGDVDHTSPASVPGLGPAGEFGPARLVAAGDTHVLVAPAAGGLLAAGSNDFGQLGMGGNDTAARAALTSVPFFSGRTDIAQVTCRRPVVGGARTREFAKERCMRARAAPCRTRAPRAPGSRHQTGFKVQVVSLQPCAPCLSFYVTLPLAPSQIAAGGDHSLVLLADGSLYAFGKVRRPLSHHSPCFSDGPVGISACEPPAPAPALGPAPARPARDEKGLE
jgi:hypothetical protein